MSHFRTDERELYAPDGGNMEESKRNDKDNGYGHCIDIRKRLEAYQKQITELQANKKEAKAQ